MRPRRLSALIVTTATAAIHTPVYGQPGASPDRPPAYTGPRVVVHRGGGPASDDRSAGEVRIHRPGSVSVLRRGDRAGAVSAPANPLDGADPLWYTRSLQSADLRAARASADWVRAQADLARTRRHAAVAFSGPSLFLSVPYIITPAFAPGLVSGDAGEGTGATGSTAQGEPAPAGRGPAERAAGASTPPGHEATAPPDEEPYTGPTIVVHRDGRRGAEAPSQPRLHLPDGTVVVMSRAGTSPGRIDVPANTVYDGPPTWYIRGLQSADVRLAEATADWVEAQAELANRRLNRRR